MNRYWVGGTGTWDASDTTHWSDTSGGAGGQSVPDSSDTVTFDASSGGGVVTLAYDANVISITMGAFTGTLDFGSSSPTLQTFSGTGTGTRTLLMGSGTWTLTGSGTTIWDTATTTNFTITPGDVVCSYSGASSGRIVNTGTSAFGMRNLSFTAGTDAITLTGTTSFGITGNLSFVGFTGSWNISNCANSMTVGGSLTLGSGMTASGTASKTITLSSTTTSAITSNSVAFTANVVIDGVAGVFTLQDNLSMSNAAATTLTLTNGTLNANDKNVTCGFFASTNSNVRTLTMGSGIWTLTGSAATIWTTSTSTNLTMTGGTVVASYSGSTGTRTINTGAVTTTGTFNLRVTAGSDTLTLTSSSSFRCNDLDFTGFSGSWTPATTTIFGSVTLSSTMTIVSSSSVISMGSTATGKTITTNGKAWNSPITFTGVGGGWTLQDALNMDGASPRALGLNAGDLNTNGMAVTSGSYSSNNSNVRSLTLGATVWTLTGTGTVWNNGGANSTCSMASSTIVVSDTSSSAKSLNAGTGNGSGTFGTITITPGGTGSFTFNANARTINTLNITGPKTVVFTSGTTTTVTNWNVNGLSGAPVSISATTPGSAATISVASGIVNSYGLILQDSTATGGATFNAVASTNVSGNTGWNFIYTRGLSSGRVLIQNIPYALMLDGSTGYIAYGTSAAYALSNAGGMSVRFWLAPQQVDTSSANSRFFMTLGDGTLNNFITFIVQNVSPYALAADVRRGGVSNTVTSNISGLLDGQWHDAAVGWDSTGIKLWLDGVLVGISYTPATSILGATPDLVSGRLNSSINARYMTGMLQGQRLFSSKPTDQQIADLHFRGITPANQIMYTPASEGSGTNLAVVGSGNAGTLTGGVTWSGNSPQKARAAVADRVAVSGRVAAN